MSAKPLPFAQGLESVIPCNKTLASPEAFRYNMPAASTTTTTELDLQRRLMPVRP